MTPAVVPQGWTEAILGDVCEKPEYGWTTSASAIGSVKLLRTTDITKGPVDWTRVPFCEKNPPNHSRFMLKSGDIVISRAGSVGVSALIEEPPKAVFASYLIRFTPLNELNRKYIAYFLQSPDYWNAISESAAGIALQNVNAKKLAAIQIPIAPLQEQAAIVGEVEKQFTRLDAAVAALRRVQANLKRYRAAVLKAACEGRLVPTEAELARREGRPYEPASELLRRILTERRARWEAAQTKFPVSEAKPTGERWKRSYQEAPSPDLSHLPSLPEGWIWTSLGQVFGVHVGATPSRSKSEYWNGDVPWVSSGEVCFCRIRETRERITQLGLENTSTSIHQPGTVLLGMIGEGKTRGQVAILQIDACNNQNSAAIRVSETPIPPEYVYRFLEGEYERTRRLSSGGNQPALNKERVRAIPVPLPPLCEAHRIVSALEQRMSVIDRAENEIGMNLQRAERLRQSLLKRAFEGKLVPQDLSDEPASVLLDRIRAERAANPSAKSTNRRSRKAVLA